MIRFTWKWNAPPPRVFTQTGAIAQQALKVLENNLIAFGRMHPSRPNLTRRERICDYFSTLWSAICGRRCDY